MPRNGAGTYTLPAGNPVVTNTTITAAWGNDTMEDLGNEITNSLSRDGDGGMNAPLRFVSGTQAVPGIGWVSETSSGFYYAGPGEYWASVLGIRVLQYTVTGLLIPTGINLTVQGAATITGVATLTAQPVLSSLTASKPVFSDASKGLVSTGTLAYDQGGTGQTTYATGDIVYASAINTLSKLTVGSTGQVLKVAAGAPAWATDTTAGTVTSVAVSGGTTGLTSSGGPITDSGTITLAGTLAPANGGTGVANNAASTLTITGAYATTLTVTAATGVTLPTTGTLATLAGSETLTNKTLTSPTLTTPALGTPASGNLSTCTADGTDQVGFKNIPQNSQSAAYTLVLADAGKHIFHPSGDTNARTFTIPANASVAYPIGTALTFINMTTQVVTIAITTDTMYLSPAGTTGSRSLALYGSATAIKMTTTTWLISGSGLT